MFFIAWVCALSFPGRTDAQPVNTKAKATIIWKHLVILGTHVKTTHRLCKGRFGVAVGVSLDKSSVTDCSCSKWSKSIVSQALRLRIDLFSSANAYYNQAAVRNTYGSTFRIQYLRSRLHTAVVKTHRRSLGILAKAARSNSL